MIGIHFSYITKIPGDTLLTKMLSELSSTEQTLFHTSRLVPLEFNLYRLQCISSFVAYKLQLWLDVPGQLRCAS